jgi:Ser/Thr protein kinase RdoA (MazF antagonist)
VMSGVLPVTYSILSADALLERIGQGYDLGTPLDCRLVRPGTNDTYVVTTRENRFIARVYGARWRTLPEISYELELLGHLAAGGVGVSLPIAGRDGIVARPVPAPEGIRYLVLFTCAPGEPLNWERERDARLAGRAAASIHAASDDFEGPNGRFQLDLEYLVDAPLAALEPFLAHRPNDWRDVRRLAARLRNHAEASIEQGLDWGVCHGDLGNRNVYLADEDAVTVIDFDLAASGWRAYDFVAAQWLASYSGRTHIWEAFVNGYTKARPLAPADLAAVPVFHGISRLWTIGLDAGNAQRWGTLPMSDFYLDSSLESLRSWEDDFG